MDTDVEMWSGKRSKSRREVDSAGTALLLEVMKENWVHVMDRKVPRRAVFGNIAEQLRKKGVRITRNPSVAWEQVYNKWRKLKETYCGFVDSSSKTGNGSSRLPPFYDELHELLGIQKFFNIR